MSLWGKHLGGERRRGEGIWVRASFREEAARGSQCCEEPVSGSGEGTPMWPGGTQTLPNHPGLSGTEPSTLPTSWFPTVLPGNGHAQDLATWILSGYPGQPSTPGGCWTRTGRGSHTHPGTGCHGCHRRGVGGQGQVLLARLSSTQ